MTRRISAAVYERIFADLRKRRCWRHFRLVPDRSGRWFPFLSFGFFVLPLPGRRALAWDPASSPSDGALAASVFSKFVEELTVYELSVWGVAGLTRGEADYLDRLEAEVQR